jgi:hypothetical protein
MLDKILAEAQSEPERIKALALSKPIRSHWSYLAGNTAKLKPYFVDNSTVANCITQVDSSTVVYVIIQIDSSTMVYSITPVDIETGLGHHILNQRSFTQ